MHEPNQHSKDEFQMWQAIQHGDTLAFAQFYDFHVHALYRYAQRITHDEGLIDDAIQDVFFELWNKRAKINYPNSFRFYLLAMLRNRIMYVAKNTKFTFLEKEDDFQEESSSPETAYIEEEVMTTQQTEVKNYLSKLPENQQQALVLRFFEELSYPEIATLMQIKEQSVRNLIQRSISKLRELMKS